MAIVHPATLKHPIHSKKKSVITQIHTEIIVTDVDVGTNATTRVVAAIFRRHNFKCTTTFS